MVADRQDELTGFHQFVGEQLADPSVHLSPEQALALWRHRNEERTTIREGLADVEAGRTRPVEKFIEEFRQRHQILEDA